MTPTQLKSALKSIGAQIKQKRESLGISQPQLAKATDITKVTIISIEKGHRPATLDNIVKVCKYLGIDSINFEELKK